MNKLTLFEKIKYNIFPFFEFKKKNLSLSKKIYISLNTLMMAGVVLFISLYLFLSFFYQHTLKTNHITIYANESMNDNKKFVDAVNYAEKRLQNSFLYNNTYTVQIYLIDNPWLYNYMATPFHMDTVATNILDYINIRNQDIKASQNSYTFFSKEIVHEVTHTLQAIKYGGWIKSKLVIPYWVSEGYAEYIEEHKIVHKNPKNFLKKNQRNKNYTLYALMVKHAIEKMHYSVDDLHLGKVAYNKVLNSLLDEYHIPKTS